MKYRIILIAVILAGISSCKSLEDIVGSYKVLTVGTNDYSSYDITLNISTDGENRVSGKSACNNYSGSFENPKANQIVIGNIMGTKMYCKDTNDVERDYLNRLSQVRKVITVKDRIELLNDKSVVIITAVRTEEKK